MKSLAYVERQKFLRNSVRNKRWIVQDLQYTSDLFYNKFEKCYGLMFWRTPTLQYAL